MAKRNPRLKKAGTVSEYTPEMISELRKCKLDPAYFARNYVMIKHAKRGKIRFNLYPYQVEMLKMYQENRYNIILSARQTGKTETTCAFLLWYAIFHGDKTILVVSNKASNAKEMIGKIQYAYEELPEWLKPGIDDASWNKHECAFDNKSRIIAQGTSTDSGRGLSISLLYCDEFAFVRPHIQAEFWDSVSPTLATGGSCIISSTPNGDSNLFAELWRKATLGSGDNVFKHKHVRWDEPPGRGEEFKQQQIGILGERKWRQEYECVTGDTIVTVKDKRTGRMESIPIRELDPADSYENYYQLLTEDGFQDFATVVSRMSPDYVMVTLSNGSVIKCSPGHKFKSDGKYVAAIDLQFQSTISPANAEVVAVEHFNDEIEVFDPVGVSNGNHYITNGVTSHNCDFLSSDGGLMDSYIMGSIQNEVDARSPDFTIRDHNEEHDFYAKINPLNSYIVGVDPATGSGLDYSVIQVFEFPSMLQVMEYRNNVMEPVYIYSMLKKIINFISNTGAHVYFSAENNGVGQSIIALYMADEIPPGGTFVSEDGKNKLGIVTSAKSKIRACVTMKNMIEKRGMNLTSETLVKELKSYVRKSGSYMAQIGATDDCISAVLIVIRIVEEIANFDEKAYHMMYQFEQPESWKDDVHPVQDLGYTIPAAAMRG